MKRSISEYLTKRADTSRWPMHAGDLDDLDTVVVIPCLAESENLPRTLESLAACSTERKLHTLVICVVNNRAPGYADEKDIQDNQAVLAELRQFALGRSLRLAYVDASSPGCELPKADGVGMARKIGLDWGLCALAESNEPVRLLCSLDADTLVEPNYLDAVQQAFAHERPWAGVVHFEHPLPEDSEERRAIVAYECFLRSHVQGLRQAGSPYAFHTVGSTMVCTPEAYVAVSGMNRRRAAEDFYFLQQLAKTGEMRSIATTAVYPSARASHRVPFGTGRSVRETLEGVPDTVTFHAPASYRCVRRCIEVAQRNPVDGDTFLEMARTLDHELPKFLRLQKFDTVWLRIVKNAITEPHRLRQFHTWFDAFKTLKLVHFLREHGNPDVDLKSSARSWPLEEALDCADAETLLSWLREQDKTSARDLRGLGKGPNWQFIPFDPRDQFELS